MKSILKRDHRTSPPKAADDPARRERNRRRSGQSIILAVIVLFLLMFLGGIFIAILRRNMTRTERHGQALNAQQLAEAGLEFADGQLTHGVEGADWRPEPVFATTGQAGCFDEVSARTPNLQDAMDPDFHWVRAWAPTESGQTFTFDDTRAEPQLIGGQRVYPKITIRERGPSGGFSRVSYGGGRYLVRVTYNPNNNPQVGPVFPDAPRNQSGEIVPGPSPLSRNLMIESIGREGIVDPDDPTTYVRQSLRRQLVAFKPLGIVDYARFFTDKQRTGDEFQLGASKFPLIEGMELSTHQDAQNEAGVPGLVYSSEVPAPSQPELLTRHTHTLNTIYGPVRSNGSLKIQGEPMIVLNQVPQPGGQFVSVPQRGDKLEIVGHLERTGGQADLALRGTLPNNTNVTRTEVWNSTVPTAAPNLNRPGVDQLVAQGVHRIEAPDLTAVDPTTRNPRYKQLTRYSTPVQAGLSPAQIDVAARNGLGAGIYIDNGEEIQTGKALRPRNLQEEWLNPGSSDDWSGPIYSPPGVSIQLLPGPYTLSSEALLDGKILPSPLTLQRGVIGVTRTDRVWRIPNTNDPNDRDGTVVDTYTQYFQYPLLPDEAPENAAYPPTFANGVLFAEGNVKIWGKLPQDRNNRCFPEGIAGQRLSVVSNGTIYIEGSLLKGDPVSPDQERRSGLAVMARDYVAVNATSNFMVQEPGTTSSWAPYRNELGYNLRSTSDQYSLSVLNAVDAGTYPQDLVSRYVIPPPVSEGPQLPPAGPVQQALYTQAAGESTGQGAGVALRVNYPLVAGGSFFHPWWEKITTTGQPNRPSGHVLTSGGWNYEATPLHPFLNSVNRQWFNTSAAANFLQFNHVANQPAYIAKVATLPLDVRIEAAIYAMNGSFFIIPGVPFNIDGTDLRGSFKEDLEHEGENEVERHGSVGRYIAELERKEHVGGNLDATYPYPFALEPLDIKLLILGTVAENRPASSDAQEAWARLWGWTPLNKAAQNAWMAHGGDGLSFQYDPSFRAAMRFDRYGRPLPLMPRLPASPDMVFSGEAQ